MSFLRTKQISLSGLSALGLAGALLALGSHAASSSLEDAGTSVEMPPSVFSDAGTPSSLPFAFAAARASDQFEIQLAIPMAPLGLGNSAAWIAGILDGSVRQRASNSFFDLLRRDGRLEAPSFEPELREGTLLASPSADRSFGADDLRTALRTASAQGSGRSLLDRNAATRLLRGVIDVKAENDGSVVFSVLGMGHVVLARAPASGAVRLSELPNEWSDALLDWLSNPLAIIVMMIAGVIALLAAILYAKAFLRRRFGRKRKAYRRRRHRRASSVRSRQRVHPGKP